MLYIRNIKVLLVSLLLTLFLSESIAQPMPVTLPDGPGEKIQLFTDRDLYVTTEQIFFSALCIGPGEIDDSDWSQVLYVELIRWNGSRITGTKVFISAGRAQGVLEIPADIESGNYYLRAYTKWMRNYSPYRYSHLLLKIVNPTTAATENGPEETQALGAPVTTQVTEIQNNTQFSGLKEVYGKRERVELELDMLPETFGSQLLFEVVRKGTKNHLGGSFAFEPPVDEEQDSVLEYYPEIRGLSLTGKVVDSKQRQPVTNMRVNLSTVSEPLYFFTTLTDIEGDFIFTFPVIRGDHEFHIAVEDAQNLQTELLIDNDFCKRTVSLPYHTFFLTAEETPLVRTLALNAQMRNRFGISSTQSEEQAAQEVPFYGAPDRIIYEKEYIELKNIEEFFYELVYEVGVRRVDGKTTLQMRNFGTLLSYPPLVLMDNIRIDDIDELLAVSCRRVDRIELINKGYVVGDQFYSGVISLYSEENDMAGMKLGGDNNFFNLAFPVQEKIVFPDYARDVTADPVPDLRNTLAWEPIFDLLPGEPITTSFYTPDVPGTYTVLVSGTGDQGGTVVVATQDFVVKE